MHLRHPFVISIICMHMGVVVICMICMDLYHVYGIGSDILTNHMYVIYMHLCVCHVYAFVSVSYVHTLYQM